MHGIEAPSHVLTIESLKVWVGKVGETVGELMKRRLTLLGLIDFFPLLFLFRTSILLLGIASPTIDKARCPDGRSARGPTVLTDNADRSGPSRILKSLSLHRVLPRLTILMNKTKSSPSRYKRAGPIKR